MKPTKEQEELVQAVVSGKDVKGIAYAGAAKTTTGVLAAEAMPDRRGMYLAFNRAIAEMAATKFPSTVTPKTFHALALSKVGKTFGNKLNLPKEPPFRLAQRFGIRDIGVRSELGVTTIISAASAARLVMDTVDRFCRSGDDSVGEIHVSLPEGIHADDAKDVRKIIAARAAALWSEFMSPRSEYAINHNVYLKAWALTKPVLTIPFIILDEWQDADGLMLSIINAQSETQTICFGDPHQQIYAWRGAINALDQCGGMECRLTQSFRFGDAIANVANAILGSLGEDVPLRGTPSVRSQAVFGGEFGRIDAVLCRTNASALRNLLSYLSQGLRVHLEADTARIAAFSRAAKSLQSGQRTTHPDLMLFENWEEVQFYADSPAGADIAPMVKLIDDNKDIDFEDLLGKTSKSENADITISTAHKSKGLEWDSVVIDNDFRFGSKDEEGNDKPMTAEEKRLFYVACTRARHTLHLGRVATEFSEEFPEYVD
jgi:hypothetical protein